MRGDEDLDVSLESVAYVPDRFHVYLSGFFDLRSKPPDMHVYRPVAAEILIAPDLVKQNLAGKNSAAVGSQELQQFILAEGKFHRRASQGNLAAGSIDNKVASGDDV